MFCAAVILPVDVTNAPETLFAVRLPTAVILPVALIVPVADRVVPVIVALLVIEPVAETVVAFKVDDVFMFPIALIFCAVEIFPLVLMLPPAFN